MNNNFPSNISLLPPVGYRFHPTDEELIVNYLEPKLQDDEYQNPFIGMIDICKYEPWDLPARSMIKSNDPVWYFYWDVKKKFTKSKQMNRTTREGYWKSTGKSRLIKSGHSKKVIADKRSLVYHLGRPKGIRTEWVMHEYKQQGNVVLCKLKKRSQKKYEKDDTNHCNVNTTSTFDYQNQELNEMNSMISMSSQHIADTNYFVGSNSSNQSVLESTNASDLACDRSDVSFHATSLTNVPLSGMTINTTQEIDVSNLETPNLDKQDNISATSSANFGILGQQEKVDDLSSFDGMMASDFLLDLGVDGLVASDFSLDLSSVDGLSLYLMTMENTW